MIATPTEKQPNPRVDNPRLNVGHTVSYALMGIIYEMQAAINEQTAKAAGDNHNESI